MRPVVFLDFDGVLNSARFHRQIRAAEGERVKLWDRLDPHGVARVNEIVGRAGADVVVSSSWRLMSEHDSPPTLQSLLHRHGFMGRVVGVTPGLGCSHRPWTCSQAHRGHEIDVWLQANGRRRFVILDDSADMQPHMDRLVRTTWEDGLQDQHVARAVELLSAG